MTGRTHRDSIAYRFGTTLTRLRKERHLTCSEVGSRAGVSGSYVRMVERGMSMPTLPVIIGLAEALDLTPAELMRELTERGG